MNFLEIAYNLKDKVLQDFKDNIAIIAIYGSYAWSKPTDLSDLDMFAIIDDNSKEFNENFIYDSRSVDFWSMSWETANKMAKNQLKNNPWCVSANLLIGSKIIYSRSPEDLVKFKQLKDATILDAVSIIGSLHSLFKDLFFYTRRIEKHIPDTDLLTRRWVLWNYINTSVQVISILNEKPLTSNWGSNIKELTKDLAYYPTEFQKKIRSLSYSNDKQFIVKTLNEISLEIEKLIQSKKSSMTLKSDQNLEEQLAEEYIGIIEYVNKAKSACREKDIIKLSYVGTELQAWLNELLGLIKSKKRGNLVILDHAEKTKELYLRHYNLPDLVPSISKMDFKGISKELTIFERKIKEIFSNLHISIKEFQNKDELMKYLGV
jgi:hypothetical protein